MRSQLVAFAIVIALSAVTAHAQNQIPNWEFDEPVVLRDLWNLWEPANFTDISTVQDAKLSGRNAMKIDIGAGSLDPLLVFRSYLKLEQGKTHYISFMAKADAPRPVTLLIQARSLHSWQVYWSQDIELTTEPQLFNFEYVHTSATVGGTGVFNSDIDFHFNLVGNGTDLYVDRVWLGTEPPPPPDKTTVARAYDPVPGDMDDDVPIHTSLSWGPGVYAQTHNVYLGVSFEDVDKADISQAVSKGQTETTFQPAGPLEYGQTYYWRVDEVNAPPTSTVFKGQVWSFTVEPFTYPITNVIASASSSEKTTNPPQNTVNGSGLTDDLHSTASTAMWVSSMTGAQPTWIQFQFDRVYVLDEMWVWNYNVEFEPVLGYGFKDVTIEYSLDGTAWTALPDAQFAQATAQGGYAPNTIVDLNGVTAKYVRFTAQSNWSTMGLKQYGLSEVRFFHIPVVARQPDPADGAANVPLDATLSWRPGREAVSHQVYFGQDREAVAHGTAAAESVTENRYSVGDLEYGKTYYWKVNEVNDASVREGDIWSFSTTEFFAVDDFESYNDSDNRLYDAWIDGFSTQASGSVVGYMEANNGTFGETVIVQSGKQSMPMDYDNSKAPFYSEAEREFASPQDWTASGVTDLTLFVRGYPAVGSVAVTETAGKMTLTGAGADIWNNSDEFTYAYKTLTGDGTMTARVVSNGAGTNTWAKGGVMIRDSLNGGSTQAMMVITGSGGNGASFQYRDITNGASVGRDSTAAVAPPYWVKMERMGDTLTGYVSPDGKSWNSLGATIIAMDAPVCIGLCVTSHVAGTDRTFQFDSISSTGGVSGAWQGAVINAAVHNSAESLYVTVEDSSGKKATGTHATAANSGAWTEVRFPLASFAGVNVAKVKKLVIGVGDRSAPQAGGIGRIFVDDIRVGRRGSSDPGTGVGYYALEDNAVDGSGSGHDGTVAGTPVYIEGPTGMGKALQFNGAGGQHVKLGTWNPSAATGRLSVSVWAKWAGLTTFYQGLIGKRDTWAADQMMWQIEANQTTGAVTFSRTESYPASGNPVLPIGEWAHVLVTFDGTTARFFVNGKLTGQGAFSFGTDPEAGMAFGACEGGGGNPFNGALDEVRLFDRALSAFEINYLAGAE